MFENTHNIYGIELAHTVCLMSPINNTPYTLTFELFLHPKTTIPEYGALLHTLENKLVVNPITSEEVVGIIRSVLDTLNLRSYYITTVVNDSKHFDRLKLKAWWNEDDAI